MNDLFKKKELWCFVGGIAATVFAGSKTCRKLCVNTVAKSLKLKDDAMEAYQNIKDEAEDIYEDAKVQTDSSEEKA